MRKKKGMFLKLEKINIAVQFKNPSLCVSIKLNMSQHPPLRSHLKADSAYRYMESQSLFFDKSSYVVECIFLTWHSLPDYLLCAIEFPASADLMADPPHC